MIRRSSCCFAGKMLVFIRKCRAIVSLSLLLSSSTQGPGQIQIHCDLVFNFFSDASRFPEVAEKVFNRCVKPNGLPVDHPQYAITLNYEFLDDVSLEWAGFLTPESSDHEGSGVDAVMDKIKSALPENVSKQVEIKSNHPLMLMVRTI